VKGVAASLTITLPRTVSVKVKYVLDYICQSVNGLKLDNIVYSDLLACPTSMKVSDIF
jgi:hypothetical protein